VRKDSRKPSKLQFDSRYTGVEEPDPCQLSLLPEPVIEQHWCSGDEIPWAKHTTPEALAKAAAAEDEREAKEKVEKEKPKLGKVIKLPAKQPEDPMLRLEQNLGCELPVCVSNRRQVNNIAIEATEDGITTWRLVRTADSFLPAPEHYLLWLWFLDRCQAAARAGCKIPPRIAIDPQELHDLFGGSLDGRWYENVHEAFRRFSRLVIEAHQSFYGGYDATLGTLCYFVSRRMKNVPPEELKGFEWGWIAPGQMLWESILAGYMKAVPMQTMLRLPPSAYVAQRLTTYLMKHCRPGERFKISLTKLLPKIPMDCSVREAKRKLRSHHEALVKARFLASEPVFEGRGANVMVTYERTQP
jgi:hypothetical protein